MPLFYHARSGGLLDPTISWQTLSNHLSPMASELGVGVRELYEAMGMHAVMAQLQDPQGAMGHLSLGAFGSAMQSVRLAVRILEEPQRELIKASPWLTMEYERMKKEWPEQIPTIIKSMIRVAKAYPKGYAEAGSLEDLAVLSPWLGRLPMGLYAKDMSQLLLAPAFANMLESEPLRVWYQHVLESPSKEKTYILNALQKHPALQSSIRLQIEKVKLAKNTGQSLQELWRAKQLELLAVLTQTGEAGGKSLSSCLAEVQEVHSAWRDEAALKLDVLQIKKVGQGAVVQKSSQPEQRRTRSQIRRQDTGVGYLLESGVSSAHPITWKCTSDAQAESLFNLGRKGVIPMHWGRLGPTDRAAVMCWCVNENWPRAAKVLVQWCIEEGLSGINHAPNRRQHLNSYATKWCTSLEMPVKKTVNSSKGGVEVKESTVRVDILAAPPALTAVINGHQEVVSEFIKAGVKKIDSEVPVQVRQTFFAGTASQEVKSALGVLRGSWESRWQAAVLQEAISVPEFKVADSAVGTAPSLNGQVPPSVYKGFGRI